MKTTIKRSEVMKATTAITGRQEKTMSSEKTANAAPVDGIVIHPSLIWRPAMGTKLTDYPWGTLCKDSKGNLLLVGDSIDGSEYDRGCGCCSDRIAEGDIVEVATICEFVRKDG